MARARVCVGVASILALCAAAFGDGLTLVEDGASPYVIVIPADPLPTVRLAAEELQTYLQKATGVRLPITTDATDLVANGAFDEGLEGWRVATPETVTVDTEVAPDGTSQSVCLRSGPKGAVLARSVFHVLPERTYRVELRSKGEDLRKGAVRVWPRDEANKTLPDVQPTWLMLPEGTTDWAVSSCEVTMPQGAVRADLTLMVPGPEHEGEGALWLTDVKMTCRPPVTAEHAILVGESRLTRELGVSADELVPEGFTIQTADTALVLLGRDSPGGPVGTYTLNWSEQQNGTLFAVYTLLRDYLGVRWLWPGPTGEVVPRTEQVSLPELNLSDAPGFAFRRMMLLPVGEPPLYSPELREEFYRWERRNRLGISRFVDGNHSWHRFVPASEYGETRPELFALVGGERLNPRAGSRLGAQLCTSNPDVVRLVADKAIEFLDAHPEATCVSVGPNDGGGFCECEACRALDTGETTPEGRPILSDRIFAYVNQVAELVARRHPDKTVGCLAYSFYREPPRRIEKMLPNVTIGLAMDCAGWGDPTARRHHEELLDAWAAKCQHLFVYEYYGHSGYGGTLRLCPHNVASEIRDVAAANCVGLTSEVGANWPVAGPDYYVAAQLLWDPEADVDELLEDYCGAAFGPGAEAMMRYFGLLEDAWNAHRPSDLWDSPLALQNRQSYEVVRIYGSDLLASCRRCIDEAGELCAADDHRARVGFFERGLRLNELTAGGLRAYERLCTDEGGRAADLVALQEALQARRALLGELEGDLTFSPSLVTWCDETEQTLLRRDFSRYRALEGPADELLVNGAIEGTGRPWHVTTGDGSTVTLDAAVHGAGSTASARLHNPVGGAEGAVISQWCPIDDRAVYLLGCECRTEEARRPSVRVSYRDGDGGAMVKDYDWFRLGTGTSPWRRVGVAVFPPAGAVSMGISVIVSGAAHGGSGTLWVDNISLRAVTQ